MSEAYKREAEIFEGVSKLPPDERAAFLDRACEGDQKLRQRIESLLQASDSQGGILDAPAGEGRHAIFHNTVALTEKPGDRIGRYKLLEQIGAGGCGVVYMAEQEEPVRRRVALKIIKLGMDTRSVVARFEAERQALALMDHPNIAMVLDAGATETGRPYFVMELVRGVKITQYCDEKQLSTRARLELFIQVCQAIQHAHQKGIIHRDIKPSNVLVTVNDGLALPKVIDFGVAKATNGQPLTDKTVYTAFEQFIGTPAYTSPEQTLLMSLDVDTRSDVYTLGVLLYELLTGKPPFDSQELLSIGLDAMRQVIRETDPPRPSIQLSTMSGKELTTTAQRRGLTAPRLISELRGDLDWIIMKAMDKDRTRRYGTASGLAMDVARHLGNEPVVACPPGKLYRLRKLIRRNKLVFAAGSAAAASLMIGLVLSTHLLIRERAAREQADEQRSISAAVNEFLQEDLLSQSSSFVQAEAGYLSNPNLTVREALDRAAMRIDRFRNHPLQEAAVRASIGRAFQALGEDKRAIPHLQRSLELYQSEHPPDHPDTLGVQDSLGSAYTTLAEFEKAIQLHEITLERKTAVHGPDHPQTLDTMNHLANAYLRAGEYEKSIELFKATLEQKEKVLGQEHRETLQTMRMLAYNYYMASMWDQALPVIDEAVKRATATMGPDHPDTLGLINVMAGVHNNFGQTDKAIKLWEDSLNLLTQRLGPDHPETIWVACNLAGGYTRAGNLDRSMALYEETMQIAESKLGRDHPLTLLLMENLVNMYGRLGMLDKAREIAEETVERRKSRMGQNHPMTLRIMKSLGTVYMFLDMFESALPLLESVLEISTIKLGSDHWETLLAAHNLAGCYAKAGLFDKAIPLMQKTQVGLRKTLPPNHAHSIGTQNDLAEVYEMAGYIDKAIGQYEEALIRSQAAGRPYTFVMPAMEKLLRLYEETGATNRAAEMRQAIEDYKAKSNPETAENSPE